jgi:hypothetical protein
MFVVKNMDTFTLNSDIHSIHTRQGLDLRYPTYKLTKFRKGVYCSGIKIYNNLPQNLLNMTNDVNKFKHVLKKSPYWLLLLIAGISRSENNGKPCFLQIT